LDRIDRRARIACALFAIVSFAACAAGGTGQRPIGTIGVRIAVELPLAGDAGGDGLRARDGIEAQLRSEATGSLGALLATADVHDTAHGGLVNPHQDEGTDASRLPSQAAAIVRTFGTDRSYLIAIGGLHAEIAAADALAANALKLPLVTLAPLEDACVASTAPSGRSRADASTYAVSVAGGASLESLAVAQLLLMSKPHRVAILTDRAPARARQSTCLGGILARHRVAYDVDPKRGLGANSPDALIYFGPAERGALLCHPVAAGLLTARAFAAMAHRGYDSRTLPPSCAWIRRTARYVSEEPGNGISPRDEDAASGAAAVHLALAAVQQAVEKRGRDFTKVTRTDVAAALRKGGDTETLIGSTMRACAGGSADRATFEVVPRRPNLPASLSVEDERCAARVIQTSM
jgi:hypothetical protein